jgi:hypothetical protein
MSIAGCFPADGLKRGGIGGFSIEIDRMKGRTTTGKSICSRHGCTSCAFNRLYSRCFVLNLALTIGAISGTLAIPMMAAFGHFFNLLIRCGVLTISFSSY